MSPSRQLEEPRSMIRRFPRLWRTALNLKSDESDTASTPVPLADDSLLPDSKVVTSAQHQSSGQWKTPSQSRARGINVSPRTVLGLQSVSRFAHLGKNGPKRAREITRTYLAMLASTTRGTASTYQRGLTGSSVIGLNSEFRNTLVNASTIEANADAWEPYVDLSDVASNTTSLDLRDGANKTSASNHAHNEVMSLLPRARHEQAANALANLRITPSDVLDLVHSNDGAVAPDILVGVIARNPADPTAALEEFQSELTRILNDNADLSHDVACWLVMTHADDVDAALKFYREEIERLVAKFPQFSRKQISDLVLYEETNAEQILLEAVQQIEILAHMHPDLQPWSIAQAVLFADDPDRVLDRVEYVLDRVIEHFPRVPEVPLERSLARRGQPLHDGHVLHQGFLEQSQSLTSLRLPPIAIIALFDKYPDSLGPVTKRTLELLRAIMRDRPPIERSHLVRMSVEAVRDNGLLPVEDLLVKMREQHAELARHEKTMQRLLDRARNLRRNNEPTRADTAGVSDTAGVPNASAPAINDAPRVSVDALLKDVPQSEPARESVVNVADEAAVSRGRTSSTRKFIEDVRELSRISDEEGRRYSEAMLSRVAMLNRDDPIGEYRKFDTAVQEIRSKRPDISEWDAEHVVVNNADNPLDAARKRFGSLEEAPGRTRGLRLNDI